jgi:hypothetical protein
MSAPETAPLDFYAWLREQGWVEDTSPGTELWAEAAWFHEGREIAKRESWLAEEYDDYLFSLAEDRPAFVTAAPLPDPER